VKLLAIETATAACSVALIEDGFVIDAAHAIVGRGHAERLLPMIAALQDGGRADAICVDVGPGSFTGIRVGVAAARALGFGWGVPVTGFSSLALVAAIDGNRPDTSVAIEGGHGELFIARYGAGADDVSPHSLPFDEAIAALSTQRVIGNAAARVVEARGWGDALSVDPDARAVALLVDDASLPPIPFYGRMADATPMAARS
jgi:tRNA threonylcarbamoyl adenosine modification protein YeaZ